ncbi:MAG: alpha/beta fold hydrolase [Xanthobacteraceae bacterium]|jgi:pimeloyl-ACP methyl ester carboxylesterase|uniref:alpha/beta fold hydrolase n=1 Tax=Pseudolabrys sp. TaxID=1960880 RepID=UPI003D130079
MPVATVRGVEIFYRVIGKDGPWIAMIPGGRRGHDEFVPLAEKIAAHGFRVLLHDRRNTGASGLQFDTTDTEEAIWADDLYDLLKQLNALPAFISGSSSGARTSLLFALRHPDAVRALLLLRVTGGAFAAKRLPEMYYDQYIRAAEQGGMPAVLATEHYAKLAAANPKSRATLEAIEPHRFVAMLKGWREKFVAGANLPVMGVTDAELATIKVPVLVIPGNDNTHSSESGRVAARKIAGSTLHELPIKDEDVPIIHFDQWTHLEPEIAQTFAAFMRKSA